MNLERSDHAHCLGQSARASPVQASRPCRLSRRKAAVEVDVVAACTSDLLSQSTRQPTPSGLPASMSSRGREDLHRGGRRVDAPRISSGLLQQSQRIPRAAPGRGQTPWCEPRLRFRAAPGFGTLCLRIEVHKQAAEQRSSLVSLILPPPPCVFQQLAGTWLPWQVHRPAKPPACRALSPAPGPW